jgi:two-component system NtrC family sensor kinase
MQRQRILVVSGTSDTASWLSEKLSLSGDQVDAVTDGATAFQVVWETDYDVIVTEIGMPGIDGRDLYMAFQNTWPELTRRMLFVCGHPTAAIEDFAARTGVPFVRTPVSVTELREAVQAVVAGPPSRGIA